MNYLTDGDRIARLELTLGTLISWLQGSLNHEQMSQLISMLNNDDPVQIPAFLRKQEK